MAEDNRDDPEDQAPRLPRVDWVFTFALAAYNLVRIRTLSGAFA